MGAGVNSRLLLLLLLVPPWPLASPNDLLLEWSLARLEAEGFEADRVHVALRSPGMPGASGLVAHVDRLELADLEGALVGISLSCPAASIAWPMVTCEQARLEVEDSPWGPQAADISLTWNSLEDWRLVFDGLRYAGSVLAGELAIRDGGWTLDASTEGLRLQQAAPLQQLRDEHGLTSLEGQLNAEVSLAGDAQGVRSMELRGQLHRLAWADEAGLQAAQALRASYQFEASAQDADWRGRLQLRVLEGELYSDPVFLDLNSQPLALDLQGRWQPQRQRLRFDRVLASAGEGLQLDGNLGLDTDAGRVSDGTVSVRAPDLAWTYVNLLQPLLIGSALDDMQVEGRAEMQLQWRDTALSGLDIRIHRLDAADQAGAFGVNAVSGELHWRDQQESPASRIRFEGGHVGSLDFGESTLELRAGGSLIYLLAPVSVPFYQGRIEIPELSWVFTDQGYEAGFGVAVRDVSLAELSQALGWPEMTGRIDGALPRARLTPGRLDVAGDIEVLAFDGRMLLRGLSLDRFDSAAPVLQAELELRRLDLAKLTETFSLGRIRGRLDGEVRDLQLVAWEPNRFEAHFRSPQDDDLPHRISQRAVQDLTELGNGVSGALSAPLLRFFEEFSYDRVELKVAQRGDRAEIGGIPHASGGYYLVKGAGIPRIDVIGRNREVAWNDLLARLKSIRTEGIEVE